MVDPSCAAWEFAVSVQPLEQELAAILLHQWENVEGSYLKGSKHVFRGLRNARDKFLRQLYRCSQDFVRYVNRPDLKQEYISQWQKVFLLVACAFLLERSHELSVLTKKV